MSNTTRFTHAGATLIAESTGSGPDTFLLIHGIGMGRAVFADLIENLVGPHGRSATTIALDLPGYGDAPEPPRVLTMERTADLVAAYLRAHHPRPAVIVGHSMGTQVAAEVGARHPELVRRLVLVAPTVNWRERSVIRQALRLAQDLAVESPRVIAIGAREYLRAGPHLRGKFHAMLSHAPELAYPRVMAPTLVLRGENDYVSPRDWCRFVVGALRDGHLAEVAGHGHETMIRDAAPAAALITAFAAATVPGPINGS